MDDLPLSPATPAERRAFYAKYKATILAAAAEHNTCGLCLLAQAANESSWGRSPGARDHNNLFGIDDSHRPDEGHPNPWLTIHHFFNVKESIDRFFRGWGRTVKGAMDIDTYVGNLEKGPRVRYNPNPKIYIKAIKDSYNTVIKDGN
jgi:flagellum-specific peptidoglycan hydrolase FlgJ